MKSPPECTQRVQTEPGAPGTMSASTSLCPPFSWFPDSSLKEGPTLILRERLGEPSNPGPRWGCWCSERERDLPKVPAWEEVRPRFNRAVAQ